MKQKRILIVRPDRIGDVVLSTPIPREIKRQFPESFVAVLVRKYTRDIYLNNPHVDEILLIDDINPGEKNYFWRKVKEIKSYKFTHALMLLPDERINYILFFAGIRKRYGVGHKFYQAITFVKGISRNKYIPLRHEADYSMDLARAIGVKPESLDVEIHLTEKELQRSRELRKKYLDGKKYLIGIHSTSGNSAANWKPGEYLKLADTLLRNPDYRLLITDVDVPAELKNLPGVIYPDPDKKKSLREWFVIFKALDLLVSSSTGPMHICAALKVRTVSVFCPLPAASPQLWGPKGNDNKIILADKNYCDSFCPGDPKLCDFGGEKGMPVKKVAGEIDNFISGINPKV